MVKLSSKHGKGYMGYRGYRGYDFHHIERDLQEIGISEAIIKDRSEFRNLVNNHKFKDTPKIRTNKTWTEERKKNFSEHMKGYWQMKKAGASAK